MKQIVNIYWRDTDNIGDRIGGVGLYFAFPLPVIHMDIKNVTLSPDELADSFIIIGGGGHIHLPSLDYNNGVIGSLEDLSILSKWAITWGIGNNVHSTDLRIYPNCLNRFLLNGLRGLNNPYYWVPGPSCMSPLFDKYWNRMPTTNAVVFDHRDRPLNYNHLPHMYCEGVEIEEVICFLSTASTVFTNSYHGAYWSLLLKKLVVVPDPYSSKFYSLHNELVIKNESRHLHYLEQKILDVPKEDFLNQCREANEFFYCMVLQKIYEYMEAE